MGDAFIFFLFVLVLMASLTRETFVVILLYFFVGANLLGRWWVGTVLNHLAFNRKHEQKVFPGESIPVKIEIKNASWLPLVWLRVQDYYPIELAETSSFSQVISLSPRENVTLTYSLKSQKRGYYTIGPLHVSSGDLLGMGGERNNQGIADHITVYPRVVPLTGIKVPSRSPLGTLRHAQPIFEDPTRPVGKRNYHVGDSLRRIDWKATAATGQLQTKIFEPSIALETIVFLNLDINDYYPRSHFDATELAIVVCASIANWIISQRQATGLIANGIDPLSVDSRPPPIPSRKGRAHMMRILEVLARVKAAEADPFPSLISYHRVTFAWGTTMIVISGSATKALFDELVSSRQAGLNPILILCGENPDHRNAVQTGKVLKIPVSVLYNEKDLDIWKK